MDHIVADQLEIRFGEQVRDVRLLAGEEIVQADDVMPLGHKTIAQVRSDKTGAAGHEYSLE